MKPNRPEEYVAKQWSQTSLRGVARSDGGLQPACRLSGFGLICGPKFGDRDLDPESLAQTEGSALDWGFKAIEDTSGAEAAEAAARDRNETGLHIGRCAYWVRLQIFEI